jgi:peptidoglycan/LPS O-acetylase OafA/YrhL
MKPPASPGSSARYTDKENPGGFSHIPALDGIRGLAILLVLIEHLLWANNHTGSSLFDLLGDIRSSTFVGVNLFFALSGFLITGILIDTVDRPHYFRSFYGRRVLRIFPLYYASLLFLLLLTSPLHFVWSGWQYYYLTYTANMALFRHNAPLYIGNFNINHFWSLQVEEQFYFIWPLIVYRVRHMATRVRICLISCAAILGIRIILTILLNRHILTSAYITAAPTFSCADNLLFGCCLCILLRTHWRERVFRLAPWVLASCAIILLAFAIPNHGLDCWPGVSPVATDLIQTLGFSLVGISCAAIIAMALQPASRTQHAFQNPALSFLGKYSYGIYVFHYSIDSFLKQPLRHFFDVYTHSKGLSVVLEALIAGILSVIAAMLSYYLLEVHFLRLKRYFSYSRTPSSPELSST